jgi:ParB-like chromosome segregation protein Spo0J
MNNAHSSLIDITKRRSNRRKKSHTSVQNRHIEQQSRSVIANQSLKISDIRIGKRFRKDLGNIDELVDSIKNNGLLYPIVVTKGELLIDGARRIEAYRQLYIPDIPVRVVDIPIREDGEIDANLVRKNYTVEEVLAIKKYRESIEPSFQGKRNDLLELRGKFPQNDINQRRERIAKSTGRSYKTLSKLEEVVKAAEQSPEQFGHLPKKIDSGQMSVSKASMLIQRENKKQEILEKARAEANCNNNDKLKLFQGDFRYICRKHIPDDSIDLIFTDPPYDKKHLQLYEPLGTEGFRMLREGGSLLTYVPHYALPEIFDYMKNSGLTYWWIIAMIHGGGATRMHKQKLWVGWKPILWFVKGNRTNTVNDISDIIKSQPVDKALDEWEQSTVEADHCIRYLTVENQTILDPMMGSNGTTGISALKLGRKFIGIEIDGSKFLLSQNRLHST